MDPWEDGEVTVLTFSSAAEFSVWLERHPIRAVPTYLEGRWGALGDSDIPSERLPFVLAQRAARRLKRES